MQNPMTTPSQPQLGTPVPGTTGGLPAISGLGVTQNPLAQQLQSYGRGDDSMLVHMTPNEVNSLQGLAMAAGGSLTVNPVTGLPEAGFLKKILPMLAGIGLNFILPGSGLVATLGGKAATAGLMVGAGTTALTGDLSKGLMAGLGAFGGASLAGGVEGALASGAKSGGATGATAGSAGATPPITPSGPAFTVPAAGGPMPLDALQATLPAQTAATTAAPNALARFGQGFGGAAKGTMSGLAAKAAPYAAGMGLLNTVSEATAPQMPKYDPNAEGDFEYIPMRPGEREVRFQTPEQMRESGGAEFQYFTPTNPEPVPLYGQQRGYAEGGTASAPSEGFGDLVSYFNAANPGAITASMYPTSSTPRDSGAAPASGGETTYNFARPAPNATANNLGIGDGMGPYGSYYSPPNFGGVDINAILSNMGYVPGNQGLPGGLELTLGDVEEFRRTPGSGSTPPIATPPPPARPALPAPATPTPVAPSPYAPPIMGDYMPFEPSRGGSGKFDMFNSLEEAYARGGEVDMRDGSFVVDARTVSELGNGSSNAGIDMLSRMGGRPVRGPGDGVSDSVRARIGGKQEARVARDEVIFSPEAVHRLGAGSDARGTKKLYALMDKAHKARKKAKRGQDTKVRKGLA